MATVFDIAKIERRVVETEAQPSAGASREGWGDTAQLLDVLATVEKTLVHNQQQIRRLKRMGKALAVSTLISLILIAALTADRVRSHTMSASADNPSAKFALMDFEGDGTVVESVTAAAPEPEVPRDARSGQNASTLEANLDFSESVIESSETDQATILLPELGQALQRPFSPPPSGAAAPHAALGFAATPPNSEEETVSQWLGVAKRQVTNLALTTPEGDNAYETYQLILSYQSDNEAALAGIEQIGVAYAELANRAVAKGDLRMASHYAAKASELAPEHPLVQAMAIPMNAERPTTGEFALTAATLADIKKPQRPPAKLRAARDGMVIGSSASAASQSLIEGTDDLVFKPYYYEGRQVVVIGSVTRLFWQYRLTSETGQNNIVIDINELRQDDRAELEAAIEKTGLFGQVRARIKGRIERQPMATYHLVVSELVLVDSRLRPVSLGRDRQG